MLCVCRWFLRWLKLLKWGGDCWRVWPMISFIFDSFWLLYTGTGPSFFASYSARSDLEERSLQKSVIFGYGRLVNWWILVWRSCSDVQAKNLCKPYGTYTLFTYKQVTKASLTSQSPAKDPRSKLFLNCCLKTKASSSAHLLATNSFSTLKSSLSPKTSESLVCCSSASFL